VERQSDRGGAGDQRDGGLFSLAGEGVAVSRRLITDAASAVEEFLGPGARVVQGGPRSSSDLILRSADGTRQVRFDLTDPGYNELPHINVEVYAPRNLYPGDLRQIYIDNKHVYPQP
jgi:hypothetical protein